MKDTDQDQFEDVRKLIALKRYETPGEAYFERFAEEFQERQRQEMLRTNAVDLFVERLRTWVDGLEPRWGFAAAGAGFAALVASAVLISGQGAGVGGENLQAQVDIEVPAQDSLLREF